MFLGFQLIWISPLAVAAADVVLLVVEVHVVVDADVIDDAVVMMFLISKTFYVSPTLICFVKRSLIFDCG